MRKTVFGIMLLGSVAAMADYTLTIEHEGGESGERGVELFKYRDGDHAKLQMLQQGKVLSETYGVGKKTYIVSYHDGKPMIMDYDAMREQMKAFSGDNGSGMPGVKMPEEISWKKTGNNVKVGEFSGEEWIATFKNDRGERESHTVVLTKNSELKKAVAAFARFTMRLTDAGDAADMEKAFTPKPGYVLLKTNEGFSFTSLSKADVPDKEFRLPEGKVAAMPAFDPKMFDENAAAQNGGDGGAEKRAAEPKPASNEPAAKADEGQETRDAINKGVDDAIDAFKSLF